MSEDKQKEIIPDVTKILSDALGVAKNIDEQVWRLELAAGRDRADKENVLKDSKPTLKPAPYYKLEQKAITLLEQLKTIEISLRKEVTLLLGVSTKVSENEKHE